MRSRVIFRPRFFIPFTLLLCLIFPAAPALADERIRRFHSQITVHPDASLTVQETIEAHSEGIEIRHGIYRDFPTDYRDRFGNRSIVDFSVKQVLRDGRPENFHFKRLSNGTRVYIGNKNVLLPPGDYTYELTYKTNRQIGFFKEQDELYWNVTGTGWVFPIEEASASVVLPKQVSRDDLGTAGYTGPQGSRAQAFQAAVEMNGTVTFVTTTPLRPEEGLTVVVSWPKGIVDEPTFSDKLGYLIHDNRALLIGLLGLAALLAYYLVVWSKVGRDPEKGSIMPVYEPPRGLSPAEIRYIMEMGFDHKTFAAAIIDMAVKRVLTISLVDGDYVLHLSREGTDGKALAPEEEEIEGWFFAGSRRRFALQQSNHDLISNALRAVKKSLKKRNERVYFLTNSRYLIPGLAITAVTVVLSVLAQSPQVTFALLFFSVWLTIWTTGVVMLSLQAASLWREVFSGRGGVGKTGSALLHTLFAVPFWAAEIVVLVMVSVMVSFMLIVVLLVLVGVSLLFYHLLKAPTGAGRQLMDKIEGFKMFLAAVEKERLNFLNPPGKTPELFEKYLPYALALGVEQAWSEQFSKVLAAAGKAGGGYTPAWYYGADWNSFSSGNFASSLGNSLSSAIASSSTAPGSSSGGGGGGSSGGGGGGGGGGGW